MALLTTHDVAERYGVSSREIGRMRDGGELPFEAKIPGKTGAYLYDEDATHEAFKQRAAKKRAAKRRSDASHPNGGMPGGGTEAG